MLEARFAEIRDVEGVARRLEKLLPELGAVRVVYRYDVAQRDAGRDLIYLEVDQAKRIVEQLLLLSELRAGLR